MEYRSKTIQQVNPGGPDNSQSLKASQAHFNAFTTAEAIAKIWQENSFKTPGGIGCCLVLDGGSAVVD